MDVRVTRADISWSDFVPQEDSFTVLMWIGGCLVGGLVVCHMAVTFLAWCMKTFSRPITPQARYAFTYGGALLVGAFLFALVLWFDGIKRAVRRKREQVMVEKGKAIAAAEVERRRTLAAGIQE